MHRSFFLACICVSLLAFLGCLTSGSASAQTLTILHSFGDGSVPNDGNYPNAALVQGSDGNFYGTTSEGGSITSGTVFKVTPAGVETVLHNFYDGSVANDGSEPKVALIQGSDGNFYGTTEQGGNSDNNGYGDGIVFKITPSGVETVLHIFQDGTVANDGVYPEGALVQGSDGNFYGTTEQGGTSVNNGGEDGTVFKITPSGVETVLHNFSALDSNYHNSDGAQPYAALILGSDGNFYGTTEEGGTSGNGTVFKITPSGVLTTLYSFSATSSMAPYRNSDGAVPEAALVQGGDGNFYGTTWYGGLGGTGTVFKVTPAGVETVLHSFQDGTVANDGARPLAALIQGSDGNFYGTTQYGGTSQNGTVFKITPSGIETVLHSFDDGSMANDGENPRAALIHGFDGNFYGTTEYGGSSGNSGYGYGTVFKLALSGSASPPTITGFTPTRGPIGTVVTVTGTNLNGVTAVRFHNANAKVFSANAAGTQLTVTVPSGAGTGTFTVTTPAGSIKTTGTFTVIPAPTVTSFTPTLGPVGTVVTVTGTNLNGVTAVRFHNANAKVFSANGAGTQLTVTVPSGAATGTFTVTTPGGSIKTTATFTVN